MSLIGCAAGGSCGGNPDDEVVMLSDGGIQVVEEEELSDIERMCRVVCSSTDILNDGLREVCGCPCLNDPAATFRAPYGNECEPPDDRCSIPEGRIRCIPCIADNGEEIAPFSSYASGNSQCYCNGGTGDMFCEAQLDVVVISGGCYDDVGNFYEGEGTHLMSDRCTTCYCDGSDFIDCTNPMNCDDCAISDDEWISHGWGIPDGDDWCQCNNGELTCTPGCVDDEDIVGPGASTISDDGCDVCSCTDDGEWSCSATCTEE